MRDSGQLPPEWFVLADRLLWPITRAAYDVLRAKNNSDLTLKMIPEAAALHLVQCIDTSSDANRRGRHAVAVCLVRQCVEALTIIDAGLQPSDLRNKVLRDWFDDRKQPGAIRKVLAEQAWPSYGKGLWDETWTEFMGEFSQAVHPYAHYTQPLQGWQLAVRDPQPMRLEDGSYSLVMSLGPETYDATKATRVTLLHCLLAWMTGRILLETGHAGALHDQVVNLGAAIAEAEWLGGGKLPWHQEFWPHIFDKPKGYGT